MLVLLPILLALAAAPIELRVGDTRPVPGTTLSVTFVRVVNDSRCPRGVTCLWAGDASVELRVTPADGPSATVQLHVNQQEANRATVHGLRWQLERLEPYPEADRPIETGEYCAVLIVTHE
jgi:hypothetical protein